jgi:integrase
MAKNWSLFERWCQNVGATALPAVPETVEAFLVYLADDHPVRDRAGALVRNGMRPASVMQALWAVNLRHEWAGLDQPGQSAIVRTAIAGIRRRKAHRPKQQAPLTIEQIAAVPFREDLKGLRDRALLLVGFAGCFRRSELVSLRLENLEEARFGLRVYLALSKTDTQGRGAWVDIVRAVRLPHACPVAALDSWIRAAGIRSGPIFRRVTRGAMPRVGPSLSAGSVDSIVKAAVRQLHLDPSQYGAHSLRAGKATYLARANKSPALIAKHGRWKSMDMVLRYFRDDTAEGLVGSY